MATHSSVLPWRIPGTGEPGGLPSMGSHRVGHDWSDLAAAAGDKMFPFLGIYLLRRNKKLWTHKAKVKVAQLCPTLWDPMDYTVHGILQARILEWVAFPSPRDLPNPSIEPWSPALQADSLPAEPQGKAWTHKIYMQIYTASLHNCKKLDATQMCL